MRSEQAHKRYDGALAVLESESSGTENVQTNDKAIQMQGCKRSQLGL